MGALWPPKNSTRLGSPEAKVSHSRATAAKSRGLCPQPQVLSIAAYLPGPRVSGTTCSSTHQRPCGGRSSPPGSLRSEPVYTTGEQELPRPSTTITQEGGLSHLPSPGRCLASCCAGTPRLAAGSHSQAPQGLPTGTPFGGGGVPRMEGI